MTSARLSLFPLPLLPFLLLLSTTSHAQEALDLRSDDLSSCSLSHDIPSSATSFASSFELTLKTRGSAHALCSSALHSLAFLTFTPAACGNLSMSLCSATTDFPATVALLAVPSATCAAWADPGDAQLAPFAVTRCGAGEHLVTQASCASSPAGRTVSVGLLTNATYHIVVGSPSSSVNGTVLLSVDFSVSECFEHRQDLSVVSRITSAAFSDVDDDGRLDVVYGTDVRDQLLDYARDASQPGEQGAVYEHARLLTEVGAVNSVAAADLDGDSRDDYVVSTDNSGGRNKDYQLAWYSSASGMSNRRLLWSGGDSTGKVITADLDSDLDVDIIAILNDKLYWFANLDGAGAFSEARLILDEAFDVAALDFLNRGRVDLVVASRNSQLLLNDDAVFESPTARSLSSTGNTIVVVGDINGDDVDDFLVTWVTSGTPTIYWWVGSHSPTAYINTGLRRQIPAQLVPAQVNLLDLFDMNGDSAADIVIGANSFSRDVFWIENDGAGNFVRLHTATHIDGFQGVSAMLFGDLGHNGHTDVVMTSTLGNDVNFFRSTFAPLGPPRLSSSQIRQRGVASTWAAYRIVPGGRAAAAHSLVSRNCSTAPTGSEIMQHSSSYAGFSFTARDLDPQTQYCVHAVLVDLSGRVGPVATVDFTTTTSTGDALPVDIALSALPNWRFEPWKPSPHVVSLPPDVASTTVVAQPLVDGTNVSLSIDGDDVTSPIVFSAAVTAVDVHVAVPGGASSTTQLLFRRVLYFEPSEIYVNPTRETNAALVNRWPRSALKFIKMRRTSVPIRSPVAVDFGSAEPFNITEAASDALHWNYFFVVKSSAAFLNQYLLPPGSFLVQWDAQDDIRFVPGEEHPPRLVVGADAAVSWAMAPLLAAGDTVGPTLSYSTTDLAATWTANDETLASSTALSDVPTWQPVATMPGLELSRGDPRLDNSSGPIFGCSPSSSECGSFSAWTTAGTFDTVLLPNASTNRSVVGAFLEPGQLGIMTDLGWRECGRVWLHNGTAVHTQCMLPGAGPEVGSFAAANVLSTAPALDDIVLVDAGLTLRVFANTGNGMFVEVSITPVVGSLDSFELVVAEDDVFTSILFAGPFAGTGYELTMLRGGGSDLATRSVVILHPYPIFSAARVGGDPSTVVFVDYLNTLNRVAISKYGNGTVNWEEVGLSHTVRHICTIGQFALGFVDRDDAPDVIVACSEDLYLLPGLSASQERVGVAEIVGSADRSDTSLRLRDVTGDGLPDLVMASQVQAAPTVRFARQTVASTPSLHRVAVADFDADGILDVAGIEDTGDVLLYRGLGNGALAPGTVLFEATTTGSAVGLHAVDIDGDGDADLAYVFRPVVGGLGLVFWFENRLAEDSTWQSHVASESVAGYDVEYPTALEITNYNADSAPDLVVGGSHGELIVLINNGDGSSWTFERISSALGDVTVNSISAVDMGDGDAQLDWVIATSNAFVWIGSSNGALHTVDASISQGKNLRAADADLDSDVDLLGVDSGGRKVVWFERLATTLPSYTAHALTEQALLDSPLDVLWLDVDNDGLPDVVVCTTAAQVVWMRNLGNGVFSPMETIAPAGQSGTHLVATDLNGDGDVTILVPSSSGLTALESLLPSAVDASSSMSCPSGVQRLVAGGSATVECFITARSKGVVVVAPALSFFVFTSGVDASVVQPQPALGSEFRFSVSTSTPGVVTLQTDIIADPVQIEFALEPPSMVANSLRLVSGDADDNGFGTVSARTSDSVVLSLDVSSVGVDASIVRVLFGPTGQPELFEATVTEVSGDGVDGSVQFVTPAQVDLVNVVPLYFTVYVGSQSTETDESNILNLAPAPQVTSVHGCPSYDAASGLTSNCPLSGRTRLTITGERLSVGGTTSIMIGSRLCPFIEGTPPTRIVCQLPPSDGGLVLVTPFTVNSTTSGTGLASRLIYGAPKPLVSYAVPRVVALRGCDSPGDANTTTLHVRDCARDGSDAVTVFGVNFGSAATAASNSIITTMRVTVGGELCTPLRSAAVAPTDSALLATQLESNSSSLAQLSAVECELPPGSLLNQQLVVLDVSGQPSEALALVSYRQCPAGQVGDGTQCRLCDPGRYTLRAGETECLPCEPGSYAAQPGTATLCTPCARGRFARAFASTECTDCLPGSYQLNPAEAECLDCAPGRATASNGTSTFCPSCPRNFFTPNRGAEVCSACVSLQYTAGAGATECERCPLGRFAQFVDGVRPGDPNRLLRSCTLCPSGGSCSDGAVFAEDGSWVVSQADGSVASFLCLPGRCESCVSTQRAVGENETAVSCCSANRAPAEDNPMCARCSDGFVEWGGDCIECDETNVALLVLMLFAMWGVVAIVHVSLNQQSNSLTFVFMYYVQMALLLFGEETEWLAWATFFNFSPITTASGGRCVAPWSPLTKLAVSALTPLLTWVFLGLTAAVDSVINLMNERAGHGREWRVLAAPYLRSCIAFFLFCYNNVALTSLRFFECLDVAGQWRVVRSSPDIDCDSDEYKSAQGLFTACLVLVMVSPLIVVYMLRRRPLRELAGRPEGPPMSLEDAQTRRVPVTDEMVRHRIWGILYEMYRGSHDGVAYYWNAVVLVRRVAVVAVGVVALKYGFAARYAALTVANILVFGLHCYVMPFRDMAMHGEFVRDSAHRRKLHEQGVLVVRINHFETVSLMLLALFSATLTASSLPLGADQSLGYSFAVFGWMAVLFLCIVMRVNAKRKMRAKARMNTNESMRGGMVHGGKSGAIPSVMDAGDGAAVVSESRNAFISTGAPSGEVELVEGNVADDSDE